MCQRCDESDYPVEWREKIYHGEVPRWHSDVEHKAAVAASIPAPVRDALAAQHDARLQKRTDWVKRVLGGPLKLGPQVAEVQRRAEDLFAEMNKILRDTERT